MIRRDVSALGDVLAEGTAIDRAVEAAYARTIQRHRQLNLPLAMWTGRTGRPSFGWYGLRRIAADMAETETTDDRVKDRLGVWQDSATRKHIYQDRETERLRAEAASVRRRMRLGVDLPGSGEAPAAPKAPRVIDLDAILASLTEEQRTVLAAHLNAPETGSAAPGAAPKANAPGAAGAPARVTTGFAMPFKERATGLEPATSSLGSWHSTN